MLDVIRYVNSKGEEVNFSSSPFFTNSKHLRQFMSGFSDGVINTTSEGEIELLTVMLVNNTEKNKVFDILDYDAVTNQVGRLYVNDWFVPCCFKGVSSIAYEDDNTFKGTLSFVAPKYEFLKETTYVLYPNIGGGVGMNFPYNYPHNFSAQKTSIIKITNSTASNADFVFEFTGAAPYVEFAIGDTKYLVNAQILAGEKFVLNTHEKKIYKSKDGKDVDLFGLADDSTYVFTQIPSGVQVLSWQGDFSVRFTLIEHRRYPEWI